MRALRERPRVTVAKGLAVLLVFALGIAFAGVVSDDEPAVPVATVRALDRAAQAAEDNGRDLRQARENMERLDRRIAALERRLRASGARNRRLTRSLRSARRQIRQLEP